MDDTKVAMTDPTTETILCHCLGVTESDVRGAVSTGAVETLRAVTECTGAGSGCGACRRRILSLLAQQQQQIGELQEA